MKKIMILLLLPVCSAGFAQQLPNGESVRNTFRITAGIQHTRIFKSIDNERRGISAAAWALDLDYWPNEHFGMGISSDVILENFIIQEHAGAEGGSIERHYPLSLVPTAYFKPFGRLSIFGGYGLEFSREENLRMLRIGTEYGIELPKRWEIGFSLIYDAKQHAYDSFSIGIGLSRRLSLAKRFSR